MDGISGLAKMVASFLIRPPALGLSRPERVRVQPPFHRSWSWYRRGYPCPGRVSTLLNQTYSTPLRLVQACLQVTEQVWHPMHLSRFITIASCAITFMTVSPGSHRVGCSRLCAPSVGHLLGPTTDDGHLVALVPGRPEIVERPGCLRITTGQMTGFDEQSGQRVVDAAAATGRLRQRHVDDTLLSVIHEDHTLWHAMRDGGAADQDTVAVDCL